MMRARITQDIKDAMKAGDKDRLGTLRLITAAIKDREIGVGGQAPVEVGDTEVVAILQKMVKQRRESIATYEQAGRTDLADKEKSEIAVLEGYLPKQMDEAATKAAIGALIAELGAAGPKDMGRVMGALKERFAGEMDFGRASGLVKELLS
ncbi:MAG TPA: GatB/YqeY domain-containing protein [Hyphomicrobium sp.]|nr:GatB/YqeY domain-containing protein [Hyphomicrobium sp.]HRO51033.1 GatB/YqeY domain-containing protein [Hyphomicrobium sp.]